MIARHILRNLTKVPLEIPKSNFLRQYDLNYSSDSCWTQLALCSTGKTSIEYISDIHVDFYSEDKIPKINPSGDILAICGNVGNPSHSNFHKFFDTVSKQYEKVLFVPGHRDLMCSNVYNRKKIEKNINTIKDIIKSFDNVIFLNKDVHIIKHCVVVLGAINWQLNAIPLDSHNQKNLYRDLTHIFASYKSTNWLQSMISDYQNYEIIIMTPFSPSFDNNKKQTIFLPDTTKHMSLTWLYGNSHKYYVHHSNDINRVTIATNPYISNRNATIFV